MKKIDAFITVAIFLVLIQTFLEEFALLAGWPLAWRNGLIVSGFLFDLFFTLEFLFRFYSALSQRRGKEYLLQGRGWIDFLAAIPLLLLDSGPRFYALSFGGGLLASGVGSLNVLKAVKAVRLARILRFLRVLKLFRNIKYVDSPMAQRHLARISTLAVSCLVFSALAVSAFSSFFSLPDAALISERQQRAAVEAFTRPPSGAVSLDLSSFASTHSDLLLVKQGEESLYSRHSNEYYHRYFGSEDYRIFETEGLRFFFDLRDVQASGARERLRLFILIIVLLGGILFLYGPHFALSISDPVHVMRRGFQEDDYNLAVKLDSRYAGDDLFCLASVYNDLFLPMKARERFSEQKNSSVLQMTEPGDFSELFEGMDLGEGEEK